MTVLWTLFLTFLKIGAFTFGGGYAMIALIESEFVSRKKWIDSNDFMDMVAISESTPGPIAINSATYIGYKLAGVAGAVVSTAAVCLPAFVIIYTISLFLDRFLNYKLVENAFRGVQVCVVYLVVSAGIKMLGQLKRGIFSVAVLISVMIAMILLSLFAVNFSSVYFILISGVCGLVVYFCRCMNKPKGGCK